MAKMVAELLYFDILSAYLVDKINKDKPCQPIQTIQTKLNMDLT